MGLAVEVGALAELITEDPEGAEWMQGNLDAVNQILAANGLPPHQEPKELPELDNRCALVGHPYSFLHYLRRAFAYRVNDPEWMYAPPPGGELPEHDAIVQKQYDRLESHLLVHSDAEGFYIPQDFQPVLFADEKAVPGGMIGSSYRLMDDLCLVAPALRIEMQGTTLPDQEADSINQDLETQNDGSIERIVWLSLFEAARLSLEHKAAISFT